MLKKKKKSRWWAGFGPGAVVCSLLLLAKMLSSVLRPVAGLFYFNNPLSRSFTFTYEPLSLLTQ